MSTKGNKKDKKKEKKFKSHGGGSQKGKKKGSRTKSRHGGKGLKSECTEEERVKPTTPKTKEAWDAEAGAKKLVASFLNSFDAINREFGEIRNDKPTPDKCGMFMKNMQKNRQIDAPIADDVRVKFPTAPDNFISAAKVAVPDTPKNVLIAQLPDAAIPGAIEDFWRMVFDESCTNVHIGFSPGEIPTTLEQMMPVAAASFMTYGKMFVNNKKVDVSGKNGIVYTFEILPDGCSNSLLSNVHVWTWKKGAPATTASDLANGFEKTVKSMDTPCFASGFGTGRAGTMAVLFSTMYYITKDKDAKIKDTLQKMRGQRCSLVENGQQYSTIYQSVAWWIKNKSNDEDMVKKMEEFCTITNVQ